MRGYYRSTVNLHLGLRYDLRGPAEPERLYPAILEHAARAEAAGFDGLWVSERPFAHAAVVPAALPLLAAIAARTTHIRVGSALLPLPLYHPLRLAEDAATLDGLSGGRLELGLGLGEHTEGFDGFGVPVQGRLERFEESLLVLRQAWGESPVQFEGQYYRLVGPEVFPKPVQRPGPPVWIGASADTGVRLAARLADGFVAGTRRAAERFLQVWCERGRDPAFARVALEVGGAAHPDAARARAAFAAETGDLGATPGELHLLVPVLDPLSGSAPGLGFAPQALERLQEQIWRPFRNRQE
ncbi:MAG TPA: LLM class flavin-dependent oxidoreductase [Myxococcota bacterium]|nr:LLM class flavin-dependent oxidoreductase [Myxococcota bacterium]